MIVGMYFSDMFILYVGFGFYELVFCMFSEL